MKRTSSKQSNVSLHSHRLIVSETKLWFIIDQKCNLHQHRRHKFSYRMRSRLAISIGYVDQNFSCSSGRGGRCYQGIHHLLHSDTLWSSFSSKRNNFCPRWVSRSQFLWFITFVLPLLFVLCLPNFKWKILILLNTASITITSQNRFLWKCFLSLYSRHN